MGDDEGMPQLRIALAQVNATVGDLEGNASLVVEWTRKAREGGAHLVVFPEMVLAGYPVEDLAIRTSFARASAASLEALASSLNEAGLVDVAAYVGYLEHDSVGPRNAAAVLHGGRVVARQSKHHLPNYGVFDERRYFKPGSSLDIVRINGVEVGMVICEDLWQDGGPITALGDAGVDLVVSPNASPY
jgi:NAD+ synthase (glutamine-hydrolysing)